MADTVSITPGTGAVISTDELNIDGTNQQVQRVKIGLGANNAWDMDLDSGQQTMANSVPVTIASNQTTIAVSGIGSTEQNIYLKNISADTSFLSGNGMWQTYNGGGTEASVLRVTIANNSTGLLSVDDNNASLTVDGTVAATQSGIWSVQENGAALTALQLLDNIVSGTGVNISQINGVTPLMGNGATGTGSLRVTIANDNTAIPVASHAVTNAGTFVVQENGAALTALQLIDNIVSGTGANISQMNGVAVTMGNGASGTGVQRVTIASDSTGQVNSMGNIVDNAGFTDGTTRLQMAGYIYDDVAGTALTENDAAAARVDSKRAQMFVMEDATTRGQKAIVTSRGSQYVEGPIAHAASAVGNPVTIGAYSISSEQASAGTSNVSRLVSDLAGKLITLPYANPENFVSATVASGIGNTVDRQLFASQGAGVRTYITSILVTNAHATVGTMVHIKAGSTIIHSGYAAAAGGGFSLTLPVPLRCSTATALNAACVTSGADVWVSVAGYKGA